MILGEIGEVVRIRRRWPAQGVLPVRTTVKPRSMKSGYNQRLDRVAIAILPGQEAEEGGLAWNLGIQSPIPKVLQLLPRPGMGSQLALS